MAVGRLVPLPSLPTEIARMTLAHRPAVTSLDSIYPFVCQLAAAVLKVERIGIWFFDDNDTVLKCVNVYQMSKGTHSAGIAFDVSKISSYVESLQRRRSLHAEIVEALPWTVELHAGDCEPLGITSILDAGIFHEGRLTGVVCHEHVGPVRDWSSEEQHFAESLADFIASRLKPPREEAHLTDGDPLERSLPHDEQHCSVKQTFRNISNASLRMKTLIDEASHDSTIQKRIAVLNRNISRASNEALKLLADS
ncbi:MAG: GAF domain-containing protein [Planctomycetales bacterium]|nr:GAF domain-containing protein [Planctomycetales bacterium]